MSADSDCMLCNEKSDRIEALKAENARLKAEVERLYEAASLGTLERENARLREAIESALSSYGTSSSHMLAILRKAIGVGVDGQRSSTIAPSGEKR